MGKEAAGSSEEERWSLPVLHPRILERNCGVLTWVEVQVVIILVS